MRRWRAVVLVAFIAGLSWRSVAVRVDHDPPASGVGKARDPLTGALLVDLDDSADAADRAHVASELRRAIAPSPWPSGVRALGQRLSAAAQLYRIRPPAAEVSDVLRALRRDPEVEGVERERVWALPASETKVRVSDVLSAAPSTPSPHALRPDRFVPDDPYYRYQWHLDLIGMPRAWAIAKGAGAVVAVVDTGVLYRDHGRFRRAPDLAATRFVPGHDFVDGDDSPDDEQGHGTHVAGTIAQSTNNALGVAGVAPEAAIMPVRVLDRRGVGRWGDVAAGIRWAADHGAGVINLSLGGVMSSKTIRRAIDYAYRKGVVVVAAAGNTGRAHVTYPAADPHVIAVGAVRYDQTLTFYSSYGKGLDIVAPGGDLRVDQNGDGLPDGVLQNTMVDGDPARHDYVAWQGTSMAAPHVAGAAALLQSVGVDDPDAVTDILERTARSEGDRLHYGAGLVQASDALLAGDEGMAALRGAAAASLALLVLLELRRRGRLDVAVAPTVGWAVVTAGGLAVLPWSWVPGVGAGLDAVARGAAELVHVTGALGEIVILTPLIPLVLVALLLGVRRARPLVVGASFGIGALGLLQAALPVLPRLPWAALPAGLWLVACGLSVTLLGRLAATRP